MRMQSLRWGAIVALVSCGGPQPAPIVADPATPTDRAASAPGAPADSFGIPGMSSGFWRSQTELTIDGRVTPLTGTVLDTLRTDASARFSCDAGAMTTGWHSLGSPHTPFMAAFVEGCGQRMVYAFDAPYGVSERLTLFTLSQVSIRRT